MSRKVVACYIPPERYHHFARHGVNREEVYEVLENVEHPPLWLRRPGEGKSRFYVVLGRTAAGRYLTIPGIVFSEPPLRDHFMPATARDTDDAERGLYEQHRG